MKETILITGGAGYIGSHAILEIVERTDYDVISIDNLSNSSPVTFKRIETITGRRIENYALDLCNREGLDAVFSTEKSFIGVIHFAALKSVPESVQNPHKYYYNNINSLLNVIDMCNRNNIKNLIFSSSCSVYGNIPSLPVSEDTQLNMAESPYAHTKQLGEEILKQYTYTNCFFQTIALRYFNPVGAHRTGLLGESPRNTPTSLLPVITQTAIGERKIMLIHGDDYPTRDGTCIRDYVHVSDIADAHVKALQYLTTHQPAKKFDVINLGTGRGISVREAITSFEINTGVKLKYAIGPRRSGDVAAIYSDTRKSKSILDWSATTTLDEMVRSAWRWQQNISGPCAANAA